MEENVSWEVAEVAIMAGEKIRNDREFYLRLEGKEAMAEGERISQKIFFQRTVSEIIFEIRELLLNPNLSKEDETWIKKIIQSVLAENNSNEKKERSVIWEKLKKI